MSLDEDFFEQVIAAVHKVRLDAVVVGNSASVLHGAPLFTQDVDLLVRDTPLNRQKLLRLAEELGGVETKLSDLMDVRRIVGAAAPVDVMFNKMGGGITFNAAKSRSVRIKVGGQTACVASLSDVIKSKRAAGRDKDLAALPILEKTLAVQKARRG